MAFAQKGDLRQKIGPVVTVATQHLQQQGTSQARKAQAPTAMTTMYSDTVKTYAGTSISKIRGACKAPLIVLSGSNDDFDPVELTSSNSESEEDVTTTVMKFNRASKTKRNVAAKLMAGKESDGDIDLIDRDTSCRTRKAKIPKGKHVYNRRMVGDCGDTATSKECLIPKQLKSHRAVKNVTPDHAIGDSGKINIEANTEGYRMYDSFEEHDDEEAQTVKSGVKQYSFFSDNDCTILEQMIDDQVVKKIDTFKSCTVDRAPLRNKYFFGEGYTYGTQMKRKGPGMEELYPKGFVNEIPEWVVKFVIQPLEKSGIVPKDFINSCVINDYLAGGCIISHVDPKQLFDRPIYTISLMSDSALSFGVRFSFKPIRCSEPVYRIPLKRGCITSISGYAADNITHCVRPQDTQQRRAVIILRRVFEDAPRLPPDHELLWKQSDNHSLSHRRSAPSRNGHHHTYNSDSQRKRGTVNLTFYWIIQICMLDIL